MTRKRNRNRIIQRDLERSQEIMASPVRMDGKGEAPIVQKLLSPEFATMPHAEALDVALLLQQLIKGQASILQNLDTQGEELQRLSTRMNAYDEDARRYNEDSEKFLNEVKEGGNKLRATGLKKTDIRAKGTAQYLDVLQKQRVIAASDKLSILQQFSSEPKVMVTSPGVVVQTSIQGQPTMVIEPEVLISRGYKFILRPGVPTEVPLSISQMLERRRKIQAETVERQHVVGLENGLMTDRHLDTTEAKAWNEINKKYNSPTDNFPIASQ